MARRAAAARSMAVRSLALLLIPGVLRPARAYDQGEDITLCWVTNATERSTVREDCDGQEMRFTSEWPERLVELTNYSFSYTFTLPRWAEPTGHRPSSSEQRYELPHANIHSCQRKVGFCTPFVEDTPGLATHTVAQRLVNVEDSGSTRMLEFTSEVILQAGQYTVIAHVYWFSPDGLRHDVARARFADFEEKPSALAIGLGVGLGVMLLLGVFSAVVVARKVHRQKKQAAAQKAAAELAAKSTEAAKLARSRLIRTVMHDLRSPLMSVDNVSRTLRAMDGQVTLASVSHLLDAIGNCSSLMEHIVSDMLDFERIEAGKLHLVFSRFRVAELAQGALAVFTSAAAAKGVLLKINKPTGFAASARLLADGKRLQQCLNNGLSNAIKFTDTGKSVTVHFSLALHESREGWAVLTVSVKDEGIGLSSQELQSLTSDNMFTQVGRGQMQGNGGTGLGLNIVRQIMRLHNDSTLELRSAGHGKGTFFILTINCQIIGQQPEHASSGAHEYNRTSNTTTLGSASLAVSGNFSGRFGSSRGLKGMAAAATSAPAQALLDPPGFPPGYRALHVEDDAFVRLTLPLQTFLKLGIDYVQVEDGEKAVQLVRQGERFDCIVVDNQMPVMGGAEMTRVLRTLNYTGLILGVTGDPSGCDERKAFEASGLNQCLDKNSDGIIELVRHIEAHGARLLAASGAGTRRPSVAASEVESVYPSAESDVARAATVSTSSAQSGVAHWFSPSTMFGRRSRVVARIDPRSSGRSSQASSQHREPSYRDIDEEAQSVAAPPNDEPAAVQARALGGTDGV